MRKKTVVLGICLIMLMGIVYTAGCSSDNKNENTIVFNSEGATSESKNVEILNGSVTITKPGTYTATGAYSNGQIIVDTKEEGTVQIVLSNLTLTSKKNSAIYIKNADKTIITAATGTINSLTDATSYTYDDVLEEEPNACVFSKDNLVISGDGVLNVNGRFNNAISGKDTLDIIGCTLNAEAKNNGIKGKDYLVIKDSKVSVTSSKDGIKSDNDKDANLGYVLLENSQITVNSGEDAVSANTALRINGGTIDILKAYEGLEATTVNISDGDIRIAAGDDGINAAGGNDSKETNRPAEGGIVTSAGKVVISGGKIYINSKGDGIDANGSIEVTGGEIFIDGPENDGNGAIDYDRTFNMSGGLLISSGSSGMLQTVSQTSSQYCIATVTTSLQQGGTVFKLTDESGKVIVSYAPSKKYGSVVVCSPDIKNNTTYTATVNDVQAGFVTVSSTVSYIGSSKPQIKRNNGLGGQR